MRSTGGMSGSPALKLARHPLVFAPGFTPAPEPVAFWRSISAAAPQSFVRSTESTPSSGLFTWLHAVAAVNRHSGGLEPVRPPQDPPQHQWPVRPPQDPPPPGSGAGAGPAADELVLIVMDEGEEHFHPDRISRDNANLRRFFRGSHDGLHPSADE